MEVPDLGGDGSCQVVPVQRELSDRSRHAVAGHAEPGIFAWVALEPSPVFPPPTLLRQAARRLVERDERLPFQVGAALEVASAIDVFLPTMRFRRDGGAAFLVQGRRRDVKQPQQQREEGGEVHGSDRFEMDRRRSAAAAVRGKLRGKEWCRCANPKNVRAAAMMDVFRPIACCAGCGGERLDFTFL